MSVLVADIGGTHARFAIAQPKGNREASLSNIIQYSVEQHDSFDNCLREYQESCGQEFPHQAVFAVAASTGQDEIDFTNSNWKFRRSEIADAFAFEKLQCINDFVAVAHMVRNTDLSELQSIHDPKHYDHNNAVTTVIGPGTGLGVSYITPIQDSYLVRETEASHIGFSPVDDFEQQLQSKLKKNYGRVSAERLACGSGLAEFYRLLIGQDDISKPAMSDAQIWQRCLSGADATATEALYRYCNCLGSIAGDLVLAQGASNLVMVGSLAGKLTNMIHETDFVNRFQAKGRFSGLLRSVPIHFLDSENPGLKGAALSAFNP